ncbi:MAG: hypothetical protein IKN43_09055 [Selenomonadaceae bacterium]|nr:hypothetical protein [Selenomonadaceae bacterium]
MTEAEQKKAAKDFVKRWTDSGYERGEAQKFWLDMLNTVFWHCYRGFEGFYQV